MSIRARVPSLALLLPAAAIAVVTALASPIGSAVTGEVRQYEVMPGDTLGLVAARFGVDTAVLARDNGLRANARLEPGDTLQIDNRHIVPVELSDGIVVNLPQRRLFLFRGGSLEESYPIAVGSGGWRTPRGEFTIQQLELDPTWDVPASIQAEMAAQGKRVLTRVAPGPDNPLGSRWIGLTDSIGIHGTNAPSSIFKYSTHGCIRMATEDVEHLFERVAEGDAVSIIYEPLLVAKHGGDVFVEVHRDPYGLGGVSKTALGDALTRVGAEGMMTHPAIADVLARREGRAVALRELTAQRPVS